MLKERYFVLSLHMLYAHLRTAREAKHKCIFPRFVLMREKQLFNKDCWNVKKLGSNRALFGNPRMIKLQIEKHVVTYFKACLFVCCCYCCCFFQFLLKDWFSQADKHKHKHKNRRRQKHKKNESS